jgi:hypothetical protein
VIDALMAAYCPVIAATNAPTYEKFGVLRRFASEVEVVSQDLVKAAAILPAPPSLPVPGSLASELAAKFASSNPRFLQQTSPTR